MKESVTDVFKNEAYYLSQDPQIIAECGFGDPLLVINVATHGNEYMPVLAVHRVIESLERVQLDGRVRFTIANPPALRANKRFLLSDLNRIYPGSDSGEGEEKMAARMLSFIADADYVVDLHTAPASPAFGVLTSGEEERLRLLEMTGISRIVRLAISNKRHSLVGFAPCGVGVELGIHEDPDSQFKGEQVIHNLFKSLNFVQGEVEPVRHEYYEMFSSLSRGRVGELNLSSIKDFVPVANEILGIADSGVSYPILSDPNHTYLDAFCYLARKVEREQLVRV